MTVDYWFMKQLSHLYVPVPVSTIDGKIKVTKCPCPVVQKGKNGSARERKNSPLGVLSSQGGHMFVRFHTQPSPLINLNTWLSANPIIPLIPMLASNKKRVHFSERYNVRKEILRLDDYSEEEFHASFYDSDDYDRMRNERNAAMIRIEKGELLSANEEDDLACCLASKHDTNLRRKLSEESIIAVLLEQELQWIDNVRDEEYLAEVLFEFSLASHLEAHQRALELESTIQPYVCPGRWSPAIRKSSRKTPKPKDYRPLVLPNQPVREASFRSLSSLSSSDSSEMKKPPKLPMRPPQSPVAPRLTVGSLRGRNLCMNDLVQL